MKALEHAARRVDLINSDNNDELILEKRKNGIMASGYSETTLYKFYDEGKKISELMQSKQLTETTPPDVMQTAE